MFWNRNISPPPSLTSDCPLHRLHMFLCLVASPPGRCGCAYPPLFVVYFPHYPSELLDVDFGEPLHSLVICGATHPLEDELLKWHRVAVADRPAAGVQAERAEEVDAAPGVVEAAEEAGAAGVEDGGEETPR